MPKKQPRRTVKINGWLGLCLWLACALLLVVADQLSKSWIIAHFRYLETKAIFPGFNLVLAFNRGAAFSFMNNQHGSWQPWFFGSLALIVSLGLLVLIYRNPRRAWLSTLGLSLILSGAVGNLLDRFRYGHVIDFIQLYVKQYFWPAFNIADSAIVLGVIILIFRNFLPTEKNSLR